jgi:ectoine hydroxylase-related dioxygenase (phytanoyl-CoA dioxygenase family)
VPVKDYAEPDYHVHGLRIIDFHNSSIAGKKLSLHPTIVKFLELLFRQRPVAMQSLTFMKGTQQGIHQDFAYVLAGIPSHLAASWIALEDIDPRSGPLMYYPGSHTSPKFDWGDGLFRTKRSGRNDVEFAEWIHEQARQRGLSLQHFAPKKGDVFLWHGALAHGGALAADPALTRKSYVTHYSTERAFPRDYRDQKRRPHAYTYNDALVYRNPRHPEEEDWYRRGDRF